jgi:hypothetical protein
MACTKNDFRLPEFELTALQRLAEPLLYRMIMVESPSEAKRVAFAFGDQLVLGVDKVSRWTYELEIYVEESFPATITVDCGTAIVAQAASLRKFVLFRTPATRGILVAAAQAARHTITYLNLEFDLGQPHALIYLNAFTAVKTLYLTFGRLTRFETDNALGELPPIALPALEWICYRGHGSRDLAILRHARLPVLRTALLELTAAHADSTYLAVEFFRAHSNLQVVQLQVGSGAPHGAGAAAAADPVLTTIVGHVRAFQLRLMCDSRTPALMPLLPNDLGELLLWVDPTKDSAAIIGTLEALAAFIEADKDKHLLGLECVFLTNGGGKLGSPQFQENIIKQYIRFRDVGVKLRGDLTLHVILALEAAGRLDRSTLDPEEPEEEGYGPEDEQEDVDGSSL